MSSKLKRKSKNKYFSQSDMQGMREYASRVNNTNKLLSDAYYNIKTIAFQILHLDEGFGNKRLGRLDEYMDIFLEDAEVQKISTKALEENFIKKTKINIREEANLVPFRERFYVTRYKIHPESQRQAGFELLGSISVSFLILGLVLKEKFKFSANQIRKLYCRIRDHINTLSRFKQFGLTLDGVAEGLMEDTKYEVRKFSA